MIMRKKGEASLTMDVLGLNAPRHHVVIYLILPLAGKWSLLMISAVRMNSVQTCITKEVRI